MKENEQTKDDSSSYLPDTKEDYNRTNKNMNDEVIPVVNNNTEIPNTDSGNSACETRETPEIGRDNVLRRYHNLSHKSDKKGQKKPEGNIFTIIVIAYTLLLLVLGFVVYRDLSKRLSSIENRLTTIEASIKRNINVTIDNIKVYDVE
ncbi:MAG: hypothetical protein ACUZ8H_03785 [Candidatus Anammoxibacter sp.]